jgi:hypothetical protein
LYHVDTPRRAHRPFPTELESIENRRFPVGSIAWAITAYETGVDLK